MARTAEYILMLILVLLIGMVTLQFSETRTEKALPSPSLVHAEQERLTIKTVNSRKIASQLTNMIGKINNNQIENNFYAPSDYTYDGSEN